MEFTGNLRMGRGTAIGSFTKIKTADGPLVIGARVSVATGCSILSGARGISIGDDALISPNVAIIASSYRFDRLDRPIRTQEVVSKGIVIGRDVWIGAGCVVRDGAVIGDGCIVAPGAVVAGRLPPGSVCEGNPARPVFTRR
ncbi:MAG TPA: acyltransferase [Azospirillum sp.]|nr:acyltransferase [Azospirillum sp.]